MQVAAELRRMRTKGKVEMKEFYIDFAAAEKKAAEEIKPPSTKEEKKAHVAKKKEIFLSYFPGIKRVKRKKEKAK